VINEVSIQQLYALPYDRWEGYAGEREEILRFIRDNRIRNVVFLTADAHASLVGRVVLDGDGVAEEFITGPIATRTLRNEIESLVPYSPAAVQGALGFAGVECSNLDAYSYGLVDVDPRAGTARITLKDQHGVVLCSKTLGP